MNPKGEMITRNTISSVMTDEMSPITISELQNAENQVDNNSAIAELQDYREPYRILKN